MNPEIITAVGKIGISRSIVECKWRLQRAGREKSARISRSIVECKCIKGIRLKSGCFCISRSIMECKFSSSVIWVSACASISRSIVEKYRSSPGQNLKKTALLRVTNDISYISFLNLIHKLETKVYFINS